MAKEFHELSYDEMLDEAAGKVLAKLLRGDFRTGVQEAVELGHAWRKAKAEHAGKDAQSDSE